MKRYHLYIITLMAGLFLLNGCQDEEMYPKKSDVPEGIPVTAQLSFTLTETQEVHTKADLGKDQENAVKDLYFFVFDYTTKKLEYAHHHDLDANKQTKVSSGTVTFQKNAITSGKKNILAIANTDTYADFSSLLSEVNTMDDLAKLYATLKEDSKDVLRMSGNFMMSGYFRADGAKDDTEKGYCEIFPASEGQSAPVKLGGTVYLRHLDSKIKFDVNVDNASTKVFVPKSWQVINVPAKSYVFENLTDVSADKNDYFKTSEQPFEVFSLTEDGAYKGGSFIFYMFENRKKALGEPKNYDDRERQEKDAKGRNGDYLYAGPLAGYVVLTGSYLEYDKNHNLKVSADVKYTIHLGYVGDNPSDFNSERNTSYIYHVTVKGVNNIVLEVDTSHDGVFTENQPGAEGDVVVADQSLICDSHYETKKVTFNINKIENLSVLVKTPYDRNGRYEITDNTDPSAFTDNLIDFGWVQFARNPKNDNSSKYRTDFISYTDAYHEKNLVTIKELLQTLREHSKENGGHANDGFWDQEGQAVYTVFIDEFYYENEPKRVKADPDVKADWKDFVNGDNRQMYILCDTKFSADEQSSVTRSSIMVDQRSIKSIYNVGADGLETAWGIESVSEEKSRVEYTGGDRQDTKTNGRYNTFLLWKEYIDRNFGKNVWSRFINFSMNEHQSSTKAEFACLLRNRDLNGDGVIDADEVRWYLPATNQYVGLWIGRDALPADVRLFQANVQDVDFDGKYHFVSSNGVRFWAEEGVSTGSNKSFTQMYNIRCARNLGKYYKGLSTIEDEPEDYVKAEVDEYGHVSKVNLDYLNPAALREEKKSKIIFHSEHSGGEMNRPYRGFEVYKKSSSLNINYQNKTLETDKCPKGYRIPNQRELALISAYSPKEFTAGQLGSCTYSELPYKFKDSKIYVLGYNNYNYLHLSNGSADVTRCVKDVD